MKVETRKIKAEASKKRTLHISHSTSRQLNAILFLLPWLIGFVVFFLMPLINTVLYSFNSVQVAQSGGMELHFVGIQNYIDLFRTEVSSNSQPFLRVFTDENVNILVNTPLIVVFSLFSSILINKNFKGRGIARVIFFLPIVLGIKVVINLLMVSTGGDITDVAVDSSMDTRFLMNVLISYTFLPLGVTTFMSSVVSNIFTLISLSGVQTLVFLAGLQSINISLYEVAKIEGANAYDVFWKITLPMLANVSMFVVIYTFVDLFLMSSIATEIYMFAFNRNNIGIGSALSVVYMVNILLDLGVLMFILTRKGGRIKQ